MYSIEYHGVYDQKLANSMIEILLTSKLLPYTINLRTQLDTFKQIITNYMCYLDKVKYLSPIFQKEEKHS